jgi:hypothetical protein
VAAGITSTQRPDRVAPAAPRSGLPRPSVPELALLALFCAISCWVLAIDLINAAHSARQWTGIDGVYPEDQLQYLAWIHAASQHLLISDLFVLRRTPADYLQPLVAISGGLVAAGMAPWLALLLWQPVGVAGAFASIRALIVRILPGRGERTAALALALFGGMPGAHPDLWLAFWSWGYPFALISLAAALAALVLYTHARAGAASAWPPALLAGLAAWLHPWQGEVLIVIALGAELLGRRRGDRGRPAATAALVLLSALPLLYYAALGRLDPAWRAAAAYGARGPAASLLPWVLIPLGLPALLAYRRPAATFLTRVLRLWPPAAIVLMLADARLGSTATHVLLGISVPLGVLAVEGIGTLPLGLAARRALLIAFTLVATVPVTVNRLQFSARLLEPARDSASLIATGEARALRFLAATRTPGGVLSDYRLGLLVPERTGRRVYLGDQYWSQPDSRRRWHQMFELLGGFWKPATARRFVRESGARFLISDCPRHPRWVRDELAAIAARVRSFGCVRVYELRARR